MHHPSENTYLPIRQHLPQNPTGAEPICSATRVRCGKLPACPANITSFARQEPKRPWGPEVLWPGYEGRRRLPQDGGVCVEGFEGAVLASSLLHAHDRPPLRQSLEVRGHRPEAETEMAIATRRRRPCVVCVWPDWVRGHMSSVTPTRPSGVRPLALRACAWVRVHVRLWPWGSLSLSAQDRCGPVPLTT
ncbi:hypothetical protein L226DRAFT_329274 [Lentinus tigrinus ALCF2SS1-7]|uniref:Uncharacterized protein n=1 Tax=Lentinus tigrinus ALCF2SS1-6 TaxID=1328759 RepID=A0A5C2SH53_9APHY|nr:hypothetical protein L227DRAFT_429183 [Lentinus tigrinus ALCF2SS1-6]RPD77687.1 hypothetical protein L226DRAFT_329274 [Lentinus tigrinus ALCF2SS1-7]